MLKAQFNYTSCLFVILIMGPVVSCTKNESGGGSLLIKVFNKSQPIHSGLVTVFKDDGSFHYLIEAKPVDAIGEVYFAMLPPGGYFISARSLDRGTLTNIEGNDSVVINQKFRSNIQYIQIVVK